MDGDRRPARSLRLLAVLSLLVTFVAGAAVGCALMRAHDRHWFMHGMGGPGMGGPEGPGGHDLFAPDGPLGKRLNLTGQQVDSIHRIVQAERASADAMMREMRPRLRAHFDSTTAAIDAVLTPAQRQEFARFRAEHRMERRHHGPPGDPRDPGGPGESRGAGGPGGPPPPDGGAPPPPPGQP